MVELLPNLVALKGIFPVNIPSLVDCYYNPVYEETKGPAITFSTGIANIGTGALILVRGEERNENGERVAPAIQRIFNTEGSFTEHEVGLFKFHTDTDGHNHWHFIGFELFELISEDRKNVLAKGNKEGFCMVDTFQYRQIANSPPTGQFDEDGCKDKNIAGLSIGWADQYQAYTDDQCIELENIESGIYWLRLTANPNNSIKDTRVNKNEMIRIKIDKEKEGPVVFEDNSQNLSQKR